MAVRGWQGRLQSLQNRPQCARLGRARCLSSVFVVEAPALVKSKLPGSMFALSIHKRLTRDELFTPEVSGLQASCIMYAKT